MEIELFFKDVNNFKSLKGFSFKKTETWDTYNNSEDNSSAMGDNIPFEINDNNSNSLSARYEGDISKYLNEFVFKWMNQNHGEKYFTSGELKKLDKQGHILINIEYKIEK